MSIKKLLGTGACMVIIGVSAGASYGLFQRLTAQVATPALAQADPAPAVDNPAAAQFVASNVTTWIPPEKSDVNAPVLEQPTVFLQPEAPLLSYAASTSGTIDSTAPALPLFAHLDDAPLLTTAPAQDAQASSTDEVTPAPQKTARKSAPAPVAREVVVAAAPRSFTAPGTLRRFRGTENEKGETADNSDQDGVFEQQFPPRTALQPARVRRPTAASTTRATQRNARFRQTWATGVFR